jgi:hypothetical protein
VSSEGPRLSTLGGDSAPPALAQDLNGIGALRADARGSLWDVLEFGVRDPIPDDAETTLDAYAAKFEVDGDSLARTVGAIRFIYRESARRGLSIEALESDAATLGLDPTTSTFLFTHYSKAAAIVGRELLIATLADHGKLLTGVSYRIDKVGPSDRGAAPDTRIGLMTLRYQEGDVERRITLHAIPQMLGALRDACDNLLRGCASESEH